MRINWKYNLRPVNSIDSKRFYYILICQNTIMCVMVNNKYNNNKSQFSEHLINQTTCNALSMSLGTPQSCIVIAIFILFLNMMKWFVYDIFYSIWVFGIIHMKRERNRMTFVNRMDTNVTQISLTKSTAMQKKRSWIQANWIERI